MSDHEPIPSLPLDIALDCLYRVPLQCHSLLQQVCHSWRNLVSHSSFYQSRRKFGYSDHYGCLIQALHPSISRPGKTPVYGVSIFDAKQKTWHRLPPLPDFAHGLPLFCQCVAVHNKLILLGGWDPSSWAVLNSVFLYDFSLGQWRKGSNMPTARSFFACASVGGKIVVAGGHDNNKNALRSAEMYDVENDSWEAMADMNRERDECKAAVVEGKVAVISGFSTESQGQFGTSAEVYDEIGKKWEVTEGIWMGGVAPSSVTSIRRQLYAVIEGKLMKYKAKEEQWEVVIAIPKEVKVPACVTSLGESIFLSGYTEGAQPYEAFTCRVGTTPCVWQKVETPSAFSGLTQAACPLEI